VVVLGVSLREERWLPFGWELKGIVRWGAYLWEDQFGCIAMSMRVVVNNICANTSCEKLASRVPGKGAVGSRKYRIRSRLYVAMYVQP
jgi:hypothetical protein